MDYGFSYTLYIIFFSNQVHVLFVEEKVGYDFRGISPIWEGYQVRKEVFYMGFWETVGNGLKTVGEIVRKEQERQQKTYDNYSRYSDERLYKIAEGEDDDGFLGPHSATEKRIALKALQDRYRR